MPALAVIAVLGILASLVEPAGRRLAHREVQSRLEQLSRRLGCPIGMGGVEFGFPDRLVVRDLRIDLDEDGRDGVRISRVRLTGSLWSFLRGRVRLTHVLLDGPEARVHLAEGRPRAWENLVRRLRLPSGEVASPSLDGGDALEVQVRDGTVVLRKEDAVEEMLRLSGLEARVWRDGAAWSGEGRGVLSDSRGATGGLEWRVRRDPSGGLFADLSSDNGMRLPRVEGWGIPGEISFLRLMLERPPTGEPWTGIVEGLRMVDARWPGVPPQWEMGPGTLQVDEVRVEANSWPGDPGAIRSILRSLALRGVRFETHVGGPFPGMLRLQGGSLDLERDAEGGGRVRLQGSLRLENGELSTVLSTVRIGSDGRLREFRGRMTGPLLSWLVSRLDRHVLPWPGGLMDLQWSGEGDGRRFHFQGDLSGRGLTYFWTKICLVPVTDLSFSTIFAGDLDLDQDRLSLRLDPFNLGPAVYGIEVSLERFRQPQPKVGVRLNIPRQPCQAVASSIPPVLIPRLEGMRLTGSMDLDLQLSVDLAGLSFQAGGPVGKTIVKGVSLQVDGDLEACEAKTLGRQIRLESLDGPFVFRIPAGEKPREEPPVEVGPGTPSFVPLERIPEPVWQAALATEDMGFFKHQGFKLGLIRRAIVLNLDKGWYVYGGSTITQQLVKNLFLSREKTLARKLEEAIIVWQMERRLTKERILELYLNVIEFGRRIYGIRAAALAYFNKEPEDLTPLEGAFLMATKPAPVYAWRVYQSRQFSRWWVDRLRGILLRLWQEMQVLDEKAYQQAAPYLPLFWYPEEGLYAYPAVDPSLLVPPGMPTELPGRPPPEGREAGPEGAAGAPAP